MISLVATKTALISGAGIAGATLAYWLASDGWQVTVVEKSGAQRSSGNPVDVRGDAARVAAAMGLEARLRSMDTGVDGAIFVDGRGAARAEIRTRSRRSRDVQPEYEVSRADLASALTDAARVGAAVISGDSITSLREDRDGVDASFLHAPTERFALVFGADGLHSNVRRLAFGPERDFARPFGMFVGTLRVSVAVPDPRRVMLYNEPNRLIAIHPAGGDPGAAFIFRSSHPYDHRDPEASKQLVESVYAGSGWMAPELLAAWRAATDIYFDAVTRIEVANWARGRIALLGDAASCLSLLGEGSSNAMVAGKTLADALRSHDGDHVAAFSDYQRTHSSRVQRYQRGAGLMSHFLVPATRLGIRARNGALRMTSRLGSRPPA